MNIALVEAAMARRCLPNCSKEFTTPSSISLSVFLVRSEEMSLECSKPGRPLVQLFHEAGTNPALRNAAHRFKDGPARVRDGVLGNAAGEVAALAAQFRVQPGELDRRLAEMTSCSAYMAGAA